MGIRMIYPGVFEFDPKVEGDDSENMGIKIKLSRMPLETRFQKCFSTFEPVKGREKGLEAAMAFIRGEIDPPMLLLYGEPGRSKTHLALAIGWAFLAQLRSVSYYNVGDLVDVLRGGQKRDMYRSGEFDPSSYEAIMHYMRICMLLILDDLGTEDDTPWASRHLDRVINYRYDHQLATVITTNTLDISGRILDRMKEGRIVLCEGESYREIIQRRKKEHKKEVEK